MHNIKKRTYSPVPAAIGHPKWTSAKAAMANVLWYNNTAADSASAHSSTHTLNKTWTMEGNYLSKWMTFHEGPNVIKTKLPEGWWFDTINTSLHDIFHHPNINNAHRDSTAFPCTAIPS